MNPAFTNRVLSFIIIKLGTLKYFDFQNFIKKYSFPYLCVCYEKLKIFAIKKVRKKSKKIRKDPIVFSKFAFITENILFTLVNNK